jgi:hypothetical protein
LCHLTLKEKRASHGNGENELFLFWVKRLFSQLLPMLTANAKPADAPHVLIVKWRRERERERRNFAICVNASSPFVAFARELSLKRPRD